MLNPSFKSVAFTFASGKGLRTLMPFLLILILFGCASLALENIFFCFLLILQIWIYGIAIVVQLCTKFHFPVLSYHSLHSDGLRGRFTGLLRLYVGKDLLIGGLEAIASKSIYETKPWKYLPQVDHPHRPISLLALIQRLSITTASAILTASDAAARVK